MVNRTYKDDSFGRSSSAGIAIGLACRDSETHAHISELSLSIVGDP